MKKKLFKILRKIEKLKKEIEMVRSFHEHFDESIVIIGKELLKKELENLDESEKLLVGEYYFSNNSCLGFGVIIKEHHDCEKCKKIKEFINLWGLQRYIKDYMNFNLIPVETKKDMCIRAILKNKEKVIKDKEKKIQKLLLEINKYLDKV
jgi:hypothetical protein